MASNQTLHYTGGILPNGAAMRVQPTTTTNNRNVKVYVLVCEGEDDLGDCIYNLDGTPPDRSFVLRWDGSEYVDFDRLFDRASQGGVDRMARAGVSSHDVEAIKTVSQEFVSEALDTFRGARVADLRRADEDSCRRRQTQQADEVSCHPGSKEERADEVSCRSDAAAQSQRADEASCRSAPPPPPPTPSPPASTGDCRRKRSASEVSDLTDYTVVEKRAKCHARGSPRSSPRVLPKRFSADLDFRKVEVLAAARRVIQRAEAEDDLRRRIIGSFRGEDPQGIFPSPQRARALAAASAVAKSGGGSEGSMWGRSYGLFDDEGEDEEEEE
ncbi:hypothetical protein AA313_de0208059 [Arthrobotrys entomopaga]|nr:hypothetical protein AA313_de0208059 [Arthrobotrys entomopaga]